MVGLLKNSDASDELTIATVELTKRRSSSTFKVKFSSGSHEIHYIEPLEEMDDADVRKTWYNEQEIANMKIETTCLVKKLKNNTKIESDKETARGLEGWTYHGLRRRKVDRYVSLRAVFEEQDRQRETGEEDVKLLAKVYYPISRRCHEEARKVGEQDEAAIKKDLEKFLRSQRNSLTGSRNFFGRLSQRLSITSVKQVAAAC